VGSLELQRTAQSASLPVKTTSEREPSPPTAVIEDSNYWDQPGGFVEIMELGLRKAFLFVF